MRLTSRFTVLFAQGQYLSKMLVRLFFALDRQLAISLVARSQRPVFVRIGPGCQKGLPDVSSKPNVADLLKGTNSSRLISAM
jgi:hypothetical protein